MNASGFISRKLKFQGKIAVATTAIASFVIIISVAVSSGFRKELRSGIASISGDIRLTSPDLNYVNESSPVRSDASYIPSIDSLEGVASIVPAVYRAGIVKTDENIHGVLFKGVQDGGDSLSASIPQRLSAILGVNAGDDLTAYFIGEKVKARKFHIKSVYEDVLGSDDKLLIITGLSDMQRLNGWSPDEVSAIEIRLEDKYRDPVLLREMTQEVGARVLFNTPEDEDTVVASSALNMYPEIFSWIELIDFNVYFVLILMILVAGVNMISSLLIMLFRNISAIGTLKSVGMTDRSIAAVFLKVASSAVIRGMVIGNVVALLFCLVQGTTHLISLNPENYFVSFVPVHIDIVLVLVADIISYLAMMLFLLLPCLFVSGVDPAKTVRAQ